MENIYGKENKLVAWGLTAAISGAHTVGKASKENSGFEGFWDDSVGSGIFNNGYYLSLLKNGWGPEKPNSESGNTKAQWKLVDDGWNNEHKEMMLNTDMCLAFKKTRSAACFNKKAPFPKNNDWNFVVRHAECRFNELSSGEDLRAETAKNCCGWVKQEGLWGHNVEMNRWEYTKQHKPYTKCHRTYNWPEKIETHKVCCQKLPDEKNDCDFRYFSTGPAYEHLLDYARDEDLWLRKYTEAWHIASENG